MNEKIVSRNKILPIVQGLKKKHLKVVFTNGCFDLMHPGHIALLSRAKAAGDILIVGMNSDASVRRIKGDKRPIVPQQARSIVLAGLACVDYVVIFDESTPLELISAIKPDILVKGADWKAADIVGRDVVLQNKGKIVRIKLKKGYSTTQIIKTILEKCG